MKILHPFCILSFILVLVSCGKSEPEADAYGNFEAVETTISAEANGRILWLTLKEGETLEAGDTVGLIDTTDLHLKRNQLKAQRSAISGKSTTINAQSAIYNEQKRNLQIEKTRTENLLKANAATPRQLDDLNGNLRVLDRQIEASRSQLSGLTDEIKVIDAQIDQLNESIQRSYLINPVKGTVLNRYAERGEITGFGKPLYKIADLRNMDLRVYISGDELSAIKTGDTATVLIDTPDGLRKLHGSITWISPSAEFTPKIIQTREERVNLVYAVKLSVPNDGSLKIAMPAEVVFKK
ncbi:MAG: HlyD family efflux transporter periplasmic adaptor subunit [Lentimicrobium sp.]|jgi:HlyD family secretion protein|nr:HlyD family efflux transporter periplasmic adaptor subunit [Lentimicrobium sp.]MDD2528801.1 HlyD family efflux transporter periplasmic adaptor subunit [Lentimicrobiaceae bacterium]MDD4598373.1 HlyD family efflux transporter periplasmic adaptor subunit [Lentimicrobiaceae bacterium]MDY0025598.1 HlyD family efflux transporter periplasmic adaptor subunit [Lentimicrobium sp.]HAH59507.1 HlyD family secretion protein [Bacteroidales bacterium]